MFVVTGMTVVDSDKLVLVVAGFGRSGTLELVVADMVEIQDNLLDFAVTATDFELVFVTDFGCLELVLGCQNCSAWPLEGSLQL
jgi:hypothetical protein